MTQETQLQSNPSYIPELSIFGAYLDDRDFTLRIRVLGVSNTDLLKPVYCQLWYTGVDRAVVSEALVYDSGRGYIIYQRQHLERLYTCLALSADVPHSVSLSFDRCYREAPLMPVQVSPEPPRSVEGTVGTSHRLGVCVAMTYGALDAVNLVEWFEMNILLGVIEFNMYMSRVDLPTKAVLQYYVRRGVLRLNEVGPPVEFWCKWCQKLATISVLNDCMYRNMYRYDYIMVVDVDEFLIPRKHRTLPQLIAHLELLTVAPSFLFTNAYFFTEHQSIPPAGRTDLVSKLYTMSRRRRINPSDSGHATKTIFNPRYCISIQNHYCVLRTLNTVEPWAQFVNSDLALLHHYKSCSSTSYNKTQCRDMVKDQHDDDDALLYRDELIPRVASALTDLKISV